MHKIKLRLLALLLLTALLLGGCGSGDPTATDASAFTLPEPESTQIKSFFGEADKSAPQEVTLYYVSDDRYALNSVTSTISVGRDEELIGCVLAELFSSSTGALPHTAAYGVKLLNYEYSCATVTVNLSPDSLLYQNEIETQLVIASIVNTLLALDGVEAVNILQGGRSVNLARLPIGVYTEPIENVSAAYAQSEAEADRCYSESDVSVKRNALLYFPSQSGEYMLPEIREIEFSSQSSLSSLIDALKIGPMSETAAVSAIPESVDLFNSAPVVAVNAAGERVVSLDFNSLLLNYLAFAGLEEWEMYAGFVLTLTSFMPEIDAVCIMIDGEYLRSCRLPSHMLRIVNGMVTRDDFSGRIGSAAELFFATADGALVRKRCALSRVAAASPKRRLECLIRTQPAESDLFGVFPEGVNPEDVLGVMVSDRIASINLSANFYARCQALDAAQERRIVYAMINMLCELENIGAVRFYIEGESVETLCQSIYLKTALLPDYGQVGSA